MNATRPRAELTMLNACPHLFLANNFIYIEAFLNEHDTDLHACIDVVDPRLR